MTPLALALALVALAWLVGSRDEGNAEQFIREVASRLAGKVQMTTDGLKLYLNAVEVRSVERSITRC